jgi:hypothetical protein
MGLFALCSLIQYCNCNNCHFLKANKRLSIVRRVLLTKDPFKDCAVSHTVLVIVKKNSSSASTSTCGTYCTYKSPKQKTTGQWVFLGKVSAWRTAPISNHQSQRSSQPPIIRPVGSTALGQNNGIDSKGHGFQETER